MCKNACYGFVNFGSVGYIGCCHGLTQRNYTQTLCVCMRVLGVLTRPTVILN